ETKDFIELIRKALYISKIMRYAQGFAQLRAASEENEWNLPYVDIANIWREGCIIRAKFLQNITDAYDKNADLRDLIVDDYILGFVTKNNSAVRGVVSKTIAAGIPVPTFSAAIAYYDSYRSEVLPANIIQAQRDFFGAHTYNRVDKEGTFHFLWNEGK